MSDPYAARSGEWSPARTSDDDGWGPSTATRSGTGGPRPDPRAAGPGPDRGARNGHVPAGNRPDNWSQTEVSHARPRLRRPSAGSAHEPLETYAPARPYERGLPWWGALVLLIAIAVIGGLIDTIGAIKVNGGFNVGIVVASVIAILVVKRSHMFPVVIAPPIVYSAAAVFGLYVSSGGLDDKRAVFDSAANYLVYGFPAIASATAAVLIIAGIRLIARR